MELGQKWNGWTVDSLLGEGSFGKVYKIVREEFGYTYESALKVIMIPQTAAEVNTIRSEGMNDDSITSYYYSFVQDIASEFALMSQLRGNSNIVSYEDHTVTKLEDSFGWEICLQMELLTPMNEYLKSHTLTERDVIRLGIDICKALEICEKKHIIHRDVKPDNIFYSEQGSFKIGDFGIARQMDKMTSVMSKKGTYAYMAPEVYKGQMYDQTVDIYSLGLVLYRYMNNNRGPFQPPYPQPILYSDNEKANAMRMLGEPIPEPCNASSDFAKVILIACAYDPKERYSSAYEMRKALESIKKDSNEIEPVFSVNMEDHQNLDSASDDDEKTQLMLEPVPEEIKEKVKIIEQKEVENQIKEADESQIVKNLEKEKVEIEEIKKVEQQKVKEKEITDDTEVTPVAQNNNRVVIIVVALLIIAVVLGFIAFSYLNHRVPDVTGISGEEAEQLITDAGLEYKEERYEFSDSVPRGYVISQSKEENTTVKKGTEITVVISKGEEIEVPNLIGKTMKEAKKILREKGLKLKLMPNNKEYSDTIRKGCVKRQDPAKGMSCEQGDYVKVTESKGVEKVNVPDVTGQSEAQAKKALKKVDLKAVTTYQSSSTVPSGNIISQDPVSGKSIEKRSNVTIVVSSGAAPARQSTVRRSSGSRKNRGASSKRKKSGKKKPAGKVGK